MRSHARRNVEDSPFRLGRIELEVVARQRALEVAVVFLKEEIRVLKNYLK